MQVDRSGNFRASVDDVVASSFGPSRLHPTVTLMIINLCLTPCPPPDLPRVPRAYACIVTEYIRSIDSTIMTSGVDCFCFVFGPSFIGHGRYSLPPLLSADRRFSRPSPTRFHFLFQMFFLSAAAGVARVKAGERTVMP